MQVVYRRCGGLDVHKDTITATVLVFGEEGQREVRKQEFGTHWKELQRLVNGCGLVEWSVWRWNPRACIGSRSGTCSKGACRWCWPIRIR
jgi:hypothetical protein